jgi:integrase
VSYAQKIEGQYTGKWFGEVKGKAPRKLFDTKEEAQVYEAFVRNEGHAPGEAGAGGLTFKQVAEEAIRHGGKSGKWHAGRDKNLQPRIWYVCGIIGDVPVTQVDRKTLMRIVTDLRGRPGLGTHRKKPISSATINRYLGAASAVLGYAQAQDYIIGMPKVPKGPDSQHREETLSEAQEDALCAWLEGQGDPEVSLCVRVFAATGMREGELLKLTPDQINPEGSAIISGEHTQIGVITLKGKQTKTNRARLCFIDPTLARELREMIASGRRPVAAQLLRRFRAATAAMGYHHELVIHSLRHTTASRLLAKGWGLKQVQEYLGHSSINTTMKYAHLAQNTLAEMATTLTPRGVTKGPNKNEIPQPAIKQLADVVG